MASYKSAVEAMCKYCIYDPDSGYGTWREQVSQCTGYGCPLWDFRPTASGGAFSDPPTDPNAHREWMAHRRAARSQKSEDRAND
jgi:hypothetical protein